MAQREQEFCTNCGTRLVGGECPWHPPGRVIQLAKDPGTAPSGRRRRPKVALLLVLVMIGWGVTFRALSVSEQIVNSLQVAVEALQNSDSNHASEIAAMRERVSAVETGSRLQVDPAALAQASLPSVFTILASTRAGDSLGSAFVISARDGISTLVTNFHVISHVWSEGHVGVEVRQENQTYVGTIVQVSRAEDLAALTVPVEFPILELSEGLPDIGDAVVVIGSPFGLEGSVVTGIVSAHREGYIQFSAPVSPGDSGGPVLEADGSVVGVTVSKVTAHGAEGLSFAIPVSTVCRTIADC